MSHFKEDSYFGLCKVCGHFQEFIRKLHAIRETYRCTECKASLREREQAQAILSCVDHVQVATLVDLVEMMEFRHTRIYEPGMTGPFRGLFKKLPYYYQSSYSLKNQGLQSSLDGSCQNLEALNFEDHSFDFIITSDILGKVRRYDRVFLEISRVLRPGGYHVFTVPLQDPLPTKTISRVDTSGESDMPLLPERYHGDGKGGRALVYTDFGADIIDILHAFNFVAYLQRPATASQEVNRICTVIAKKIVK